MALNVSSEISHLNGVIVHTPGPGNVLDTSQDET